MRNEQQLAFWEDYFTTYWWIFAALCAMGIGAVGILYFEHVSGRQLLEWCSTTCAMLGVLIVALLFALTRSQLRKRYADNATMHHLAHIERRLQMLEEPADSTDNNVLLFGAFKPKDRS
jgi:hypothetical protein